MTVPRISLVLLVYNQREFVQAAAQSCLAQVGEPLEIVLSDDASSDGSFEVLQAIAAAYRGPHQVRARRNPVNLGIGGHYNLLLSETSGELIVTAAGDDLSLPYRVQALARAWDAGDCRADLIASHFTDMAPDGTSGAVVCTDDLGALTLAHWLQRRPYTTGATHAFTRRLMHRFGPFIDGIWYEDLVMVFRALGMGGALTVAEPLVLYRRDGSSKSPDPKAITGLRQRAWLARQNGRVLAEITQLVQDASLLGCADAVRTALAPQWQRETYLRALLRGGSLPVRWSAMRAAPLLPLAWRLRKLVFFALPALAESSAAVRRLRLRLRRR